MYSYNNKIIKPLNNLQHNSQTPWSNIKQDSIKQNYRRTPKSLHGQVDRLVWVALGGVVVVRGGGGNELNGAVEGELLQVWVADGWVVGARLHQLTRQPDVVWLFGPQQRLNHLLFGGMKGGRCEGDGDLKIIYLLIYVWGQESIFGRWWIVDYRFIYLFIVYTGKEALQGREKKGETKKRSSKKWGMEGQLRWWWLEDYLLIFLLFLFMFYTGKEGTQRCKIKGGKKLGTKKYIKKWNNKWQ